MIERERQAKLEAERQASKKKAEEARLKTMTKNFSKKFGGANGANAGAGFQKQQFSMPA